MPSTIESLIVLMVFVLPGYISTKIRALYRTGAKLSPLELTTEFLFFALVNFLISMLFVGLMLHLNWIEFPHLSTDYLEALQIKSQNTILSIDIVELTLLTEQPNTWILLRFLFHNITSIVLITLFSLFLAVVLGISAGLWRGSVRIWKWTIASPVNPYPSAWDQFFLHSAFCIVHIKWSDGSAIAGLFHSKSYASLGMERDIFLEKEIFIDEDGHLIAEMENSLGVLVDLKSASAIHFYPLSLIYEGNHGDKKELEREYKAKAKTAAK